MKNIFKSALATTAAVAAVAGGVASPLSVSAYNDRQTYSLQYINETGLGNTPVLNSIVYAGNQTNRTGGDFDWYKKTHNGAEVPKGTILDERNYVGAREDTGINAGVDNVWEPNQIKVEEGKTYLVRLYVHNNNQNKDAVAENVKVAFNTPMSYTTGSVQINGYISSSNAGEYVDYVNFINDSGVPFRMKYVEGSAKLENNGFANAANGGAQLSDAIVDAKDGGVLIGYDGLDGKIPGCYQYAQYVTIKVKAEFNYDYTIEKLVRLEGDKEWQKTVEAKVGDTVEFLIEYTNTSNLTQSGVVIKDILPKNLEYIPGTTTLRNAAYGGQDVTMDEDFLIQNGLNIGAYTSGSNAIIKFKAKVVNNSLGCGSNTLVNWAQAGVGDNVIQDYARVHLTNICPVDPEDPSTPVDPGTEDPNLPNELPTTGPEAIVGGVVATGAIVTAAGYYIASRRQLRR